MKKLLVLIMTALLVFSFAGCGGGGGGGSDETAFTISYNSNGSDSGIAPASQSGDDNSPQSIQANTGSLAKSGYLFDGWNTAADGSGTTYAPGTSYKGKSLTLYAKWAAIFNVQEMSLAPVQALNGVQKAPGGSTLKILGLTEKGRTLTNIDIPAAIDGNQVAAIGSGAFQNCGFITGLTIPATVTAIEGNAFAGCTGLSSLTIPASVTNIGDGAFDGCSSLNNIIMIAATPPAQVGSGILDGTTAVIMVPAGSEAAYSGVGALSAYSIEGYTTEPHTVTFDSQGATTPADPATKTTVPPAVTLGSLPTPPELADHIFEGWNTAADGSGTAFTASTVVIADITVYAQWTYRYTVTFDDQGANVHPNPTTKTVTEPATTVGSLPTAPERDNCLFVGWNTAADGSGTAFTASTAVTAGITVYAQWINFSSTVGNRAGVALGDIVLSNKATIIPANYTTYASAISSAGLSPVGVIAYIGTTGTAGITGKIYMVGLDQGSCKWAQEGTTGYNVSLGPSETDGTANWAEVLSVDSTGAANASVNYPAFNYCNTYSATGYTNGWFLPAYNELRQLYLNMTTINNAISAIGGTATALPESFIWSSYYGGVGDNVAVGVQFANGNFQPINKASAEKVRAVRALDD